MKKVKVSLPLNPQVQHCGYNLKNNRNKSNTTTPVGFTGFYYGQRQKYSVECVNNICQRYDNSLNAMQHKYAIGREIKDLISSLNKYTEINLKALTEEDGYFLLACIKGYFEEVRLHCYHNIDFNAADSCGTTALMWAVMRGHREIVNLLIQKKEVDVNAYNMYGNTALIYAAKNSDLEILNMLLEHKDIKGNYNAKLNAPNNDGYTALMYLNATNWRSETALMRAAKNNYKNVVNALLERGDVNVNAADKKGYTALMLAAENGHTDVVKALLQREDINVNTSSNNYNTALILAVENGHKEIVDALLKHKDSKGNYDINVNTTDNNHDTALMIATKKGHTDIVEMLKARQ